MNQFPHVQVSVRSVLFVAMCCAAVFGFVGKRLRSRDELLQWISSVADESTLERQGDVRWIISNVPAKRLAFKNVIVDRAFCEMLSRFSSVENLEFYDCEISSTAEIPTSLAVEALRVIGCHFQEGAQLGIPGRSFQFLIVRDSHPADLIFKTVLLTDGGYLYLSLPSAEANDIPPAGAFAYRNVEIR